MIITQLSIVAFYAARVILVLLVFMSFVTLTVFIERLLFYRKSLLKDGDATLSYINSGISLSDLIAYLDKKNTRECKIILDGLRANPKDSNAFTKKVKAFYLLEKKKWEKYTTFLGTVGSNAPFIGLLGTVLGILKSFADLSMISKGGPQAVMSGISEALIVTAVGLAVAIPAVIFFNICKNRIKKSAAIVESLTEMISSENYFKKA